MKIIFYCNPESMFPSAVEEEAGCEYPDQLIKDYRRITEEIESTFD